MTLPDQSDSARIWSVWAEGPRWSWSAYVSGVGMHHGVADSRAQAEARAIDEQKRMLASRGAQ